MNRLIGVDRRGGKGYQEVGCLVCGRPLFISNDSEGGVCARCVMMGYPKPKSSVDIVDVKKAMESNSLKQYRKQNEINQSEVAELLGITERHYRNLESGQPMSRNIRRKIDRKLSQVEQSP